jgi:inositol-phosphate phosphatase/L-galactose 1-phosphate phosphatase/histidinol-phosphatase
MNDADLALAHRLADAAGAAIRPHFRRCGFESKADATPVTVADRAAELAMRTLIEAERPEDGIIGEEFGQANPTASRVWVLDPIDGTRSFMIGRPIFGTLIALTEGGCPVLGIIDQPITGERWVGVKGEATTLNGAPTRTRPGTTLASALVATTAPRFFSPPLADALAALGNEIHFGGDCYNYGLLASGHLDLVVEQGLKLFDFAALVPIVEGAGGIMRDWSGNLLTAASEGRVVAAGDPALLESVLPLLG